MSISSITDISKLVFGAKYISSTELYNRNPQHEYSLVMKSSCVLMDYVELSKLIPIQKFPTKKEDIVYDDSVYYLERIVSYGELITVDKNQFSWLPDNQLYYFEEDKLIEITEEDTVLMEQIKLAHQYVKCMEEMDLYSGLCTTQIVSINNFKKCEKNWIHAFQNGESAVDLETLQIYPILKMDEDNFGIMKSGVEYVYPICPYETKYENGQFLDFLDSNSDIEVIKKMIKAYHRLEYSNPTILNFADYQKKKTK